MAEGRRLVGIANPQGKLPCFGVPVFSGDRATYLQVMGPAERIAAFTEFESSGILIYPTPVRLVRAVGDFSVYAFCYSGLNISVGSRQSVALNLASRKQEFEEQPFLLTEIAVFIRDMALLKAAVSRGAALLSNLSPIAVERWSQSILAESLEHQRVVPSCLAQAPFTTQKYGLEPVLALRKQVQQTGFFTAA